MIAERLTAQQLSGPSARSPEAVVRRLLAVQGQDPRGARLAVRSRSVGLHATDVDDTLSDRRSLLITWLNRGTLHLVSADDYWWLQPLTTPPLATANQRRLRQEGVSDAQADRGVDVITDTVLSHGPQTRASSCGIVSMPRAFRPRVKRSGTYSWPLRYAAMWCAARSAAASTRSSRCQTGWGNRRRRSIDPRRSRPCPQVSGRPRPGRRA